MNATIKPAVVAKPKRETVFFKTDEEFVVILGCPRKMVPLGIQVIPVSPGIGSVTQQSEESGRHKFGNVKIDVGGLFARCTVDSINVNGNENYVSVYLNCTATSGGEGLKYWVDPYGSFVKKMLGQGWNTAVLANCNGRTSLKLGGKAVTAETKLLFAIM